MAAAQWFKKAAEQGDADSQFYVGAMLAVGSGVEQSYAEAAHWFKRAADQGHAEAAEKLALLRTAGTVP